jgi:signal transduction histidine kinase
MADAERLRQVFVNLIENGINYSAEGGQVVVMAVRNWQQISISVSNIGIGILPEQIPHLFERFYRVDDARDRATGGFGLGLAITQAIVQAHGGNISAKSELEKGTTFTVLLPAIANQESA